MDCKHWNDEWVARLYGELGDEEQARATRHLAECDVCRRSMEQLESAREVLRSSAPAVPLDFGGRRVLVLRPRPVLRPLLTFAAGVACAAVLLSIGILAGASLESSGGPLGWLAAGGTSERQGPASGGFLTRAELQEALGEQRREFEQRLARYDAHEPSPVEAVHASQPAVTQQQLDAALRRVYLDQSRDFDYLLGEINDAEALAGNAWRYLVVRNDPKFTEQ